MSVIIDTTKSELESVIRYARIGANNCMIANSWEVTDVTDVTDLVRCKDCKHWHEDVANFISIPRGGCKLVRGLTNGEFFCALGERKE